MPGRAYAVVPRSVRTVRTFREARAHAERRLADTGEAQVVVLFLESVGLCREVYHPDPPFTIEEEPP